MPSITYDGRSFMVDGRRIWLSSGSLHFQRLPAESWGDRLRQIKRAGLNCVETPVFWSKVEPRPGQFDFKGDNDIAGFCKRAHALGLYVILRPGPFVGGGWDLGGLPAWLLDLPDVKLRTANQPFLEAVGRYFTALAKEVKSQQVTTHGPIVLVQTEHHWTCGHDELGQSYLGELTRYLREAGLNVPKINANNLWQGVEGDVEAWSGNERPLATMRQLGAVRPDQPRMVIDFGFKARPAFGAEAPAPADPVEIQRRLGEIVAGGGQFNITPFVGGTSFGFWAGQASMGEHPMLAPTQDLHAPVDEGGRTGDAYRLIRRLATFTTSFSRVLAHLEHDAPCLAVDPSAQLGDTGKAARGAGWVAVPASGVQGSVAFLFAPAGKPTAGGVDLVRSDGSALHVPTGSQAVYWCLFDVALSSRSVLDYSTLCALFAGDDLLVCFGPAGTTGTLSINGTPIEVEVPKGRKPAVLVHEDVTVVVVSEDLADETHLGDLGVMVGASGIGEDGVPIASGSSKTCTLVERDGKVGSIACEPAPAGPKSKKIEPEAWTVSPAGEHSEGTSPRYAQIPGPANLAQLGSAYGYGWYRITVRAGKSRRFSLAAPDSADRVQIIMDGQAQGVVGRGPGATPRITVSFSKGEHTLVALADNMGRVSGGSDLSERHGLTGHLWEVSPFKVGRSSLVEGAPIDLLGWRAPLFWLRKGDATHPMRVTWTFQHRKKSPIFVELPPLALKAAVVLNDEPVLYLDSHRAGKLTLTEEMGLKRGNNVLQIAAVADAIDEAAAEAEIKEIASQLSAGATFTEGTNALSEGASWAFAKWEAPAKSAYEDVAKSATGKFETPCWWRTTFDATISAEAPIALDLSGMTKGQVFLNGHNLGRYFVQTQDGTKVPPVTKMLLPAPWLKEQRNELVLFDEHGGNPARVKLGYES
ncbi:MAG: beta-galactosidase [Phycisphaerales bacterium]